MIKDKLQGIVKYDMSLSTMINSLYSLATVQISVVINLLETAVLKGGKETRYVQSGKAGGAAAQPART